MAMGQVYRHLVPMEPMQDSLALAALRQAHTLSPDLAPALFYLGSRAARDGDLRSARAYLEKVRQAAPEPSELAKLELEIDCASRSPDGIDWQAATLRDVNVVFQMARTFHIGMSNPPCAEEGWRAVIDHDTTAAPDFRFSATVALQSLLAALGRTHELRAVLDSSEYPSARWLYIVDALAGLEVDDRAEEEAQGLRSRLWPTRSTIGFWPLAVWDARTGRLDEAIAIRDTLEALATAAGASSSDTLLWRSVAAHVLLAEGDTSRAIDALRALRPTAPRPALTWQPWFSLGYDWLVLAGLLALRGEDEEALRILTMAETPAAAANLIFRPAMVALRERMVVRDEE
jgi:hypothetical protein